MIFFLLPESKQAINQLINEFNYVDELSKYSLPVNNKNSFTWKFRLRQNHNCKGNCQCTKQAYLYFEFEQFYLSAYWRNFPKLKNGV